MNRLFKSVLGLTGLLVVTAFGTQFLWAENRAPETAPEPRAAKPLVPVTVTDNKVETQFAVKPKELSEAVKKGLEYLVSKQQKDGGWNQGGGWRVGGQGGGRVEGQNVEDPSDIGNTSLVMLALLRAGNSPTEGKYKEAMEKGLDFVLSRVEKADSSSLTITDVQGTQLQSKIGQYVDTFLTALILAELKGKAGAKEKHLTAALEKTMTKIVKNQNAGGGFANNGGWAPILSVGIANKSIARAKQNGVVIDDRVLERAFAQSQASANGRAMGMVGGPGAERTFAKIDGRSGATKETSEALMLPSFAGGGGGFGDAGVSLYRVGQGAGNSQDVVNALKFDGEKARQVLKDSKATDQQKQQATQKLEELNRAEKENDKVQEQLRANVKNESFTAGFGSNGGEEFLSFLNISESLVVKGGKAWEEWDAKMVKGLEKAQDQGGSWSGQHCITGKTFCTAGALLVLMADRTPFPAEVLKKVEEKPADQKPEGKK